MITIEEIEEIEEMKSQCDLQKHSILKVSERIPHFHTIILGMIDYEMENLINIKKDYEKLQKDKLDYFRKKTEFDIFSIFTKDDRNLYIRNSDEEIINKRVEMEKSKRRLDKYESWIDFLKVLRGNIKNIIDYEKFRAGQ